MLVDNMGVRTTTVSRRIAISAHGTGSSSGSKEDLGIPLTTALPVRSTDLTYPLADINRAIDEHAAGQCIKAVLLP